MSEEELVKRALGTPVVDPASEERARLRLRRQLTVARPSRRGHRFAIQAACVIALITAASVVAALLPRNDAAARELSKLRRISAGLPAPQVDAGHSLHLHVETQGIEARTSLGSGGTINRLVRFQDDILLRPDGSGVISKTYVEAKFASPQDKALWEESGSPPLPESGDTITDGFRPGDSPIFDLSTLSDDPPTLLSQLRSGAPGEAGEALTDAQVFQRVGDLMGLGHPTSAQRSSLFAAASQLNGVRLEGDLSDPLGRPGVGLVVLGTSMSTMLVFDENTGALLSNETFPSGTDPGSGTPTEWTAYQPAEVVSDEAAGKSG